MDREYENKEYGNREYGIGNVVFQDWKITKEIGQGAYGRVFEIEKNTYGIHARSALKVVTIPYTQADIKDAISEGMDEKSVTTYFQGFVREIIQEVSLLNSLKGCENVVNYEDHCVVEYPNEIRWDILLRMELLDPLTNHIIGNSMQETDVINLGVDICNALTECDRHAIVHRDIKPDNIFVNENGKYKLGDFGVSRTLEKTSGASRKGTESYMAPEIYKNQPYGKTVDLYSLGLVMYRLVNGNRLPFYPPYPEPITFSAKETALIRRMKGEALPAPREASDELAAIILKACAFRPEDRFRSAGEMLLELKKLQNRRTDAGAAGYQNSTPQSGTIPGQAGDEFYEEDRTVGIFGNQAAYQKPPVQPGTAQQGTAQQGTTQQGTAQQGTTQQGTARQGTARQGGTQQQRPPVQPGTAQQGTARQGGTQQQRPPVQPGTARQGTARQQKPPVQPGKKENDDDSFKWFLIGGLLLALFVCAMFALLILGLLAASMG